MKFTYDKEVNARYLCFKEGTHIANTIPWEGHGIYIDMDIYGEVVGVEIIGPQKHEK